jgi:hypothetical protein
MGDIREGSKAGKGSSSEHRCKVTGSKAHKEVPWEDGKYDPCMMYCSWFVVLCCVQLILLKHFDMMHDELQY